MTSHDDSRHRAVTALTRHLLALDFAALSEGGFAAAFVEQVVAALEPGRLALVVHGAPQALVFAVGSAPTAALLEDESLAWGHDRANGVSFGIEHGAPEIAGALAAVFGSLLERRRCGQRLTHDAFHDPLTGLPNRALFLEHLDHAIERGRHAAAGAFCVLLVDLDRFGVANDSLGHAAGDRLLAAVAQRLRHAVRGGDVVARLGGDEFAVLTGDLAELNDAVQVANRIRDGLRTAFECGRQHLVVSASVGMVRSAARYADGAELLRDAGIAMRRAKRDGGACQRLFDTDMHTLAVARMQVESDLRRAVERSELRLAYQPVIRLADRSLHGFEALLRWRHPQRGTLLPADFLDVAEQTGLVVPVGRWALDEACRRMAVLNRGRARSLSLRIGLSPREAADSGTAAAVAAALGRHGLAPSCLCLALGERSLARDADPEATLLGPLRRLGVGLALDGFGSGLASLDGLQRVPVDAVKLDGRLVGALDESDRARQLLRAVVELAHRLGSAVVADGVERPPQLAALREAGCDFAQGQLLSAPLEERGVDPALSREDWLPA